MGLVSGLSLANHSDSESFPCIPSDLKEFKVTRKWRDAEFVITVKNPSGKQHPDQPTVLPYEPGKHEVVITL